MFCCIFHFSSVVNIVSCDISLLHTFCATSCLDDSSGAIFVIYQIKSNLFAISAVDNITVHEFTLHLAGQTGDNFALMSAHEN